MIIEDTLDIDLSAIENSSCYHVYDDDAGSNRVYTNECLNFNIKNNNYTKLAGTMSKACSNSNYTKIQKQLQITNPSNKMKYISKHMLKKKVAESCTI